MDINETPLEVVTTKQNTDTKPAKAEFTNKSAVRAVEVPQLALPDSG